MTKEERTVNVGGKRFIFYNPTIERFIRIVRHEYDKQFTTIDFKQVAEGADEYERFKALWKAFCNEVFEKPIIWRMLAPLGYIPRQLRFRYIMMTEITAVIQSFFLWHGGGLPESDAPSPSSQDTK